MRYRTGGAPGVVAHNHDRCIPKVPASSESVPTISVTVVPVVHPRTVAVVGVRRVPVGGISKGIQPHPVIALPPVIRIRDAPVAGAALTARAAEFVGNKVGVAGCRIHRKDRRIAQRDHQVGHAIRNLGIGQADECRSIEVETLLAFGQKRFHYRSVDGLHGFLHRINRHGACCEQPRRGRTSAIHLQRRHRILWQSGWWQRGCIARCMHPTVLPGGHTLYLQHVRLPRHRNDRTRVALHISGTRHL